jgi:hypothetical protein
MSEHHGLVTVLKLQGYDNEQIKSIVAAAALAESAKIEKLNASRDPSGLLTPIEAAASPRRAAELRQLEGRVRNATRFGYTIPRDGSYLDAHALDRALAAADAPSATRWEIKAAAASLNLIPR